MLIWVNPANSNAETSKRMATSVIMRTEMGRIGITWEGGQLTLEKDNWSINESKK